MMTLSTAKALIFIALTVNPCHPKAIFATSLSESYVLTPSSSGWSVTALGFPAADFSRNPSTDAVIPGTPTASDFPRDLGSIADHNWHGNGIAILPNGDRVEKHGVNTFYILNSGGANQKVFTIYYETK